MHGKKLPQPESRIITLLLEIKYKNYVENFTFITKFSMYCMNKHSLATTSSIAFLIAGLLLGATLVSAAVTSFKIKENKIFFNLLEDETEFTLPSTIGRTGQVYIVKSPVEVVTVLPSEGDTIDGSNFVQLNAMIWVADEANRTWWQISLN